MFPVFETCLIISLFTVTWCVYRSHPDEYLTTTQFITKHGYPVETHKISTEDGYILKTYRIPHGKASQKPNDKVVLLVHGMTGSAETFILLGPNDALAFMLADRGFDVWLFNARGNVNSRRHQTLRPDFFEAAKFWNFSWHEIGIYDLSANIDYILQKTRKPKLFYVGHSQGCTSYFVLTSEKPEYNNKIIVAAMLAPSVFMNYIENSLIKLISKYHPVVENIVKMMNYHESPMPNVPTSGIIKNVCMISKDFMEVCLDVANFMSGQESGLFRVSLLPLILTHLPSSIATRQVLHYIQEIKSGRFRKYDYGIEGNLMMYNQKYPPDYNLNNSIAPVANFFGNGDGLAPSTAKAHLARIIPNVVMTYEVPYNKFSHFDFLFAYNVRELLYEPVYKLLMDFIKK